MLSRLSGYLTPIVDACLIFPLVAAVFTIPFMVVNYRKYGGIALMRVFVVYSFILYSMCAFLLTVLPLPSFEAVAAMAPEPIEWLPFTDLRVGLHKAGINFSLPETLTNLRLWKAFLRSSDFFQLVANVIMQVPLGFYLRYYFRCGWKKTLLIGLLVSLFYETTQYTGLWFIYPHAYRFATVDDLMANTFGAMVGFWLTPLLTLLLPSREEIDRISYSKGQHLTLIRRMLAALLDLMFLGSFRFAADNLYTLLSARTGLSSNMLAIISFLLYFVIIPGILRGRTFGQMLLKLRVVQDDTYDRPWLIQLLMRNMLLYVVEPFLVLLAMFMLMCMILTLAAEGLELYITIVIIGACSSVLLGVVWFFMHSQLVWNTFPHGRFSHTKTVKNDEFARFH